MLYHGFYILSTEPLIVSYIGKFPRLSQEFQPKHVLQGCAGFAARWKRIVKHKKNQIMHAMRGRKHHFIINSSEEEVWRQRWFMRGGHFNHNIYINEHIYKPLDEPKHYEAIYIAQLKVFKRHWLAKDIERLIVVSYGGHLPTFCPELAHAEYNEEFIHRRRSRNAYRPASLGAPRAQGGRRRGLVRGTPCFWASFQRKRRTSCLRAPAVRRPSGKALRTGALAD